MKAAVYARVSTDRQETENQLRELREFCADRGWEVVQEYVDEAVRGRDSHKPELEAALLGAHQRKYDVLVFWALDRVERRGPLDTLKMLDELSRRNVSWVSYMERYLDSAGPWAEAVIAVVATVARMESQRKSERIKSSSSRIKGHHKTTGKWVTKSGQPWGRPRRTWDSEIVAAISAERAAGVSWSALASKYQVPASSIRAACKKRPVGLVKAVGRSTGGV